MGSRGTGKEMDGKAEIEDEEKEPTPVVEVTVFRRDELRVAKLTLGAGAVGKLRIERTESTRAGVGWPGEARGPEFSGEAVG